MFDDVVLGEGVWALVNPRAAGREKGVGVLRWQAAMANAGLKPRPGRRAGGLVEGVHGNLFEPGGNGVGRKNADRDTVLELDCPFAKAQNAQSGQGNEAGEPLKERDVCVLSVGLPAKLGLEGAKPCGSSVEALGALEDAKGEKEVGFLGGFANAHVAIAAAAKADGAKGRKERLRKQQGQEPEGRSWRGEDHSERAVGAPGGFGKAKFALKEPGQMRMASVGNRPDSLREMEVLSMRENSQRGLVGRSLSREELQGLSGAGLVMGEVDDDDLGNPGEEFAILPCDVGPALFAGGEMRRKSLGRVDQRGRKSAVAGAGPFQGGVGFNRETGIGEHVPDGASRIKARCLAGA